MLLRARAAGSRAPPTKKAIDNKTGGERRAYHRDGAQAAKPANRCAEHRAQDRRTQAAYDDERRNQQSRHKTGNSIVVHGKPSVVVRGGRSAGPCSPTNESVSHETDRNGAADNRNQAHCADPSASDRDGSRAAKRKHHRSHESPHVVGK